MMFNFLNNLLNISVILIQCYYLVSTNLIAGHKFSIKIITVNNFQWNLARPSPLNKNTYQWKSDSPHCDVIEEEPGVHIFRFTH